MTVEAAVYKWVDDQGVTHFGDLPPGEVSADRIELPQLQTYTAPAVGQSIGEAVTPPGPPAPGYQRVRIVQPLPDATVRSNTQQVLVEVAMEPALRPGHLLAFYLDGQQVGTPGAATQIELQGVERGRHSIRTEIVDADGKVLAASEPVSFYLRQASVLITPAVKPPPGPA